MLEILDKNLKNNSDWNVKELAEKEDTISEEMIFGREKKL